MPAQHFTPKLFAFLRELAANNDRSWFAANKERYERDVRTPALQFINDFAAPLAKFAPHLSADPRPVGGSMFRIHRDTRFSKDKSPYKTHVGLHFFHESAKAAASVPGFYLHLQPGESFAAAGIWHPDPASLAKIRERIAGGDAEWKALRKSKLPIEGGSLKRPPRGFDPEHPFIDDLKRTDFVTSVRLSDKDICKPGFAGDFAKSCKTMAPLVRFVAHSLDLPW
ncbi:MAG TPA: DUF2461 domain-containing protein [Thermoanaerobaculia bacterium]|nr:DUF2461 domain-containing protein [Thermoanaerobaculia bacterium]